MVVSKKLRASVLAVTAAATLTISAILPASAHFGVSPASTAAGSYSLLTFSTAHGCDGSPTTKVAIQIPEGINIARPGMNYGWTVETVTEELAATPTAEESVTTRISQIIYTAKEPLLDGYYDSFNVQVQLPETVGETVYFPLVQSCEVGENAWIQIPEEGQDEEDLDRPAPSITITEAVESDS